MIPQHICIFQDDLAKGRPGPSNSSGSLYRIRRASVPGFPKTVPKLFTFIYNELNISDGLSSWSSLAGRANLDLHSISSFGVQAVIINSHN